MCMCKCKPSASLHCYESDTLCSSPPSLSPPSTHTPHQYSTDNAYTLPSTAWYSTCLYEYPQ